MKATSRSALRAILRLAPLCPGLFWLELLLTLAIGLIPPAVAYTTASFLEAIVNETGTVPSTVALLIALTLGVLLPLASNYVQGELSRRLRAAMQLEFFTAVNTVHGLRQFETGAFRDRLAIAQQAGESAPAMILRCTTMSLQAAVSIIGFGIAVGRVSLPLSLLIIVASLVNLAMAIRIAQDRVDTLWQVSPHDRRRNFYASLLTNVQALKEIRLYELGPFFQDRMAADLAHENELESRYSARETLRSAASMLPMTICGIGGIAWLVAAESALSVGRASLLVASVAGLTSALVLLYHRIAELRQYASTYQTYDTLMSELSASAGRAQPHVPEAPMAIELRNIWFRYGDDQPWVLRDVSMTVNMGSPIGLVGKNGAGKSTLIKLLVRFYEPTSGEILLDGVPVRDYSVAVWRSMIGAVFQDYSCYDLTLYENIAIGALDVADPRTVESAAARIGVDRVAERLPNGYETELSTQFETATGQDQGLQKVSMSGGQWQRIALARALMRRNRPILLLDEPTSGMDAHAEAQVRKAVFDDESDKIVLYISHRLATLRDCSRIIVLDQGAIVESGTHEDLLGANGEYAEMFMLQSRGYRDDQPKPERR